MLKLWVAMMPTIESDGVRLNYAVSGTPNGALLVLANPLGSDMHMWDKVVPALECQYRVLRYDMRGHGKSEVTAEPFALEDLGRDVLRLMDAIDAKQASMCGLSLGGQVALWLGIHAPERVNRLVLANTAARIGSRELWEQRITTVRAQGMAALAAVMIERWFTPDYRARHAEEMKRAQAMIASTDPAGYVACCGVLRDTDLRGESEAVTASTLVITGTHDPATPPREGRALQDLIPLSRYVELEASHLSAWERANEFTGAVLEHLTRGETDLGRTAKS